MTEPDWKRWKAEAQEREQWRADITARLDRIEQLLRAFFGKDALDVSIDVLQARWRREFGLEK